MTAMPMHPTLRALLVVAAVLSAGPPAQAQVYKCQGAGGRVEYSNRPCAGSDTPPLLGRNATAPAAPAAQAAPAEWKPSVPTAFEVRGRCEATAARLRVLRRDLAAAGARRAGMAPGEDPDEPTRQQRAVELRAEVTAYETQQREQGCDRPERQAELRECDELRRKFTSITAGEGRTTVAAPREHPIVPVIAEMKRKGCQAP